MNKPDKKTLERWMNGELDGDVLRQVETWAENHHDELDRDYCFLEFSQKISSTIPASEEPPYAEFFNHKIQQAIEEASIPELDVAKRRVGWFQRFAWILAPAAVASMALCYYVGTLNVQHAAETASVIEMPTEIFVPQEGVTAEVSQIGESTIIVLDGLQQIPDSLDIVSGGDTTSKRTGVMVRQEDHEFF